MAFRWVCVWRGPLVKIFIVGSEEEGVLDVHENLI